MVRRIMHVSQDERRRPEELRRGTDADFGSHCSSNPASYKVADPVLLIVTKRAPPLALLRAGCCGPAMVAEPDYRCMGPGRGAAGARCDG